MTPEYQLNCSEACSLRPGTTHSTFVTDLVVQGVSYRKIVELAKADGYATSIGAISNHSAKHVQRASKEDAAAPEAPNATNIEILETIIQKGFSNSKNWKPTINDTMKAMDMWFRLTQNSPFDELLNAMAAATVEVDEAPEAIGLPEDGGDDDATS